MESSLVFVGREELIDELAASFTPGTATVGDVSGVFGIGKSTFLKQLRSIVPERDHDEYIVLHTDAGEFDPETSGPSLSDAELVRTHREFHNLLGYAADQLSNHGPAGRRAADTFSQALRVALREQSLYSIQINQALSFGDNAVIDSDIQNLGLTLGDRPDPSRLESSQLGLAHDFAGMLNKLGAKRRILWTVDSFDALADQEIGRWLLSLIGRLRNAVVVVARTPVENERSLGEAVVRRPLPRLTEGQTRRVFEASLPGETFSDELHQQVFEFTCGHPLTVAMAVDLYATLGHTRKFRQILDELPVESAEGHAEMALRIVRASRVEGLEGVLEACAIAPGFDVDALASLIADDADVSPRTVIDTFRRLTFIEEIELTGVGAYRVHAFISHALRRRLLQEDPARFRELHRRGATHHFRWLSGYDEDRPRSTYAGWYRYEDPVWQAHLRAWLYHEAQAVRAMPDGPRKVEERRRVRCRFIHEFMDALWWWGCYIPFSFNHDLIDDWERTQQDQGGWLEAARQLIAAYPPGYRKERPVEQWLTVEDALLALLEACGLDVPLPALDTEDRRHTRAVIEIFLAHSQRYREVPESQRERAYAAALEHYGAALDLFEGRGDAWNRAWTVFERADLHAGHGRAVEAARDWQAAAAIVMDPANPLDDEELKANLHRLRADLYWEADRAAALSSYGLAVAHAYLFQNRPHPPDHYTAAFYAEMLQRATERIRAEADHGRAVDAAAAVRGWLTADPVDEGALSAALGEGDDALARLLFPDPPTGAELMADESDFLRRWRRTGRRLQAELADDLREPLAMG